MDKFAKVKKNFFWQGIYQVAILLLGFLVPYVVLNTYGSNVNGLTATIKQVILLSSLASAGVTTAATYTLYKPIKDNDGNKIVEIITSVKCEYRRIAIITAIVCIISSIVLTIFQKGNLDSLGVLAACLLTSLNTIIDLYYTSTTSVFLTAIQEKYLISIGMIISGIVMYGGQLIICYLNLNYIFLYSTCVIGTVGKVLFLQYYFKRSYNQYKSLDNKEKRERNFHVDGIGYAFANEVAHTVNVATQSVIIAMLYGFSEASVLSVYMMVVNALSLVAQVVYSSFGPSFGAVVAEDNKRKINDVFEIFQYSLMLVNSFLYMCAVPLFIPFVKLYTSGIKDIQYVSETLVIECVLYGIFYVARVPYNIVVSATGKFKKSAIQTCITCAFTICIAIAFSFIDYQFVLWGSIIFYLTNTFYQHFMLKRELNHFQNNHFWNHLLVTFLSVLSMFIISKSISANIDISNAFLLIIMSFIISIVSVIILLVISYMLDKNSMLKTLKYFKSKFDKDI